MALADFTVGYGQHRSAVGSDGFAVTSGLVLDDLHPVQRHGRGVGGPQECAVVLRITTGHLSALDRQGGILDEYASSLVGSVGVVDVHIDEDDVAALFDVQTTSVVHASALECTVLEGHNGTAADLELAAIIVTAAAGPSVQEVSCQIEGQVAHVLYDHIVMVIGFDIGAEHDRIPVPRSIHCILELVPGVHGHGLPVGIGLLGGNRRECRHRHEGDGHHREHPDHGRVLSVCASKFHCIRLRCRIRHLKMLYECPISLMTGVG